MNCNWIESISRFKSWMELINGIYLNLDVFRRQTAEEREQERQAATKYFLSMQLQGNLSSSPPPGNNSQSSASSSSATNSSASVGNSGGSDDGRFHSSTNGNGRTTSSMGLDGKVLYKPLKPIVIL